MIEFKKLNLNEKIVSELEKKGYTQPTPIQEQAIPHILEGKDLLGIAQTGTGKTAAFALPIIDRLTKNPVSVRTNNVRCLVLTPTRELASQIADNIEVYGAQFKLKHAVIFGGVNEKAQIKKLAQGMDILIATPGRLLDLMGQGYLQFTQLEIFVLDEADRMLDMGFFNDVQKIIQRLPNKRQTLFFSATMSPTIGSLANQILNNPVKVEITPAFTTVEKITQKIYMVDRSHKASLLKNILKQEDVKHALVFSQTKHGANKIVDFLKTHGIKVAAIHGNKSQGAREAALSDFKSGKVTVLVATDIAARGIDVPGISHVINYNIPQDPESYVHRIGRTARAGREGVAISFCDNSEMELLRAVEKTIKTKIPVDETHPYHGVAGVAGAPRESSFSRGSSDRNSNRDFKPRHSSSRSFEGGRSNEDRRRAGWKTEVGSSRPLPPKSRFSRDDRRDSRSDFRSDSRSNSSDDRGNRSFAPRDNNRSDRPEGRFNRNDARPNNRSFGDRKPRSGEGEGSKFSFKKKLSSFFGFKKKEDGEFREGIVDRRPDRQDRPARPFGAKKPFHKRSGTGPSRGPRGGRSFSGGKPKSFSN